MKQNQFDYNKTLSFWNQIIEKDIVREWLEVYNCNPTYIVKDVERTNINCWFSKIVLSTIFDFCRRKEMDGIEIKSINEHFMHRLFGRLLDPKIYEEQHKIVRCSRVEADNVIDALLNGSPRKITIGNWIPSKTYCNKKCLATINTNRPFNSM